MYNRDNLILDLEKTDLILDRNYRLLREELINEMEDTKNNKKLIIEDLEYEKLLTQNTDDRLI